MNNEDNIVTLKNEKGEEECFELLHYLEYEGEEYVVLLPLEDSEYASAVVILKIVETGDADEESYVGVEDEDTLEAVFSLFKEEFQDDFNFID